MSILFRHQPPRIGRSRSAIVLAALLAVWGLGLALPGRAEAPCAGSFCWVQRGNYAGMEFSALLSPPGNPCVVAWTALDNGGLGVSTDCGVQYARLLFTNAYDVTAKDSNVGYVAAGTSGIIKTLDTGSNWFQINEGLPPSPDGRAVILHVAHPESVFVGLMNGGVFVGGPKTVGVDSAMVWTPLNGGLDLTVRALARVRGGTFLLAATNSGVWRWTQASGWSNAGPGIVANAIVVDAADSSRCYAAAENGLYRSSNFGMSWTPSSNGLPGGMAVNDVTRRTDVPNVLYVGMRGGGVYESVDFGANWRKFGPDLPGDNDVRAVLCTVGAADPDSAGMFAGTRADGLYETGYLTPAISTSWGKLKSVYRN